MPSTITPSPLLTVDDVSEYLRIPKDTLYRWRYLGEGPKASRVGKHLRYRLVDVDAWLEERSTTATSANLP